jgi:hypothetical protein
MTLFPNNHSLNPTKFRFVGPIRFLKKRIFLQFIYHLHEVIESQAFHAKKLKGRPIIIMRPMASLEAVRHLVLI